MKLSALNMPADDCVHTYDEEARVQQRVALELASALGHTFQGGILQCKWPEHIVEIGSGTGFLTRQLQALFPEATVIATDKSQPMLDVARCALPASDTH